MDREERLWIDMPNSSDMIPQQTGTSLAKNCFELGQAFHAVRLANNDYMS